MEEESAEFSCCACFESDVDLILLSCFKKHIVCVACSKKITKCPICRADLSKEITDKEIEIVEKVVERRVEVPVDRIVERVVYQPSPITPQKPNSPRRNQTRRDDYFAYDYRSRSPVQSLQEYRSQPQSGVNCRF